MGIWLLVFILGAGIMLITSMIAGLKDNVFAAQMALSVGVVFDMFAVGLLVYVVLKSMGAI